ncbi:related to Serine/threonine-protein kinase BUD32 [Ramularia collo-cygni]|uniref:EKC/KEOPS complex subunit BUD32 n=1 Tax=Ramularia collo-cygni TaxID=112498 RepID=A0A2D3V6Z2_9PEZI|nr:related to Serine/threonine-protein kinase BUD32 [Ramularia collo-cygni]CZT22640.1 related to Serine/threonine-protein kinase BUD32 [Ramularia collo-cygni]
MTPQHPLPPPFSTSPSPFTLIIQGAESLLYHTTSPNNPTEPCALKIRPSKLWRHPLLDKRLTKQRILAESRVLVKLSQSLTTGQTRQLFSVPAVLGMDWENGWLALEWIEGRTVKAVIRGRRDGREEDNEEEGLKSMMRRIGIAVATLHSLGIVHGDLTTSNLMLRGNNVDDGGFEGEVVVIDFGLSGQSVQEEERAVDLYVLERAFGSTHPREEGLFGVVLEGYLEGAGGKWGRGVLRRLEDVRMRGRKKSMIG